MRLTKKYSCDVLVAGAGIAGISAALSAAEAGSSVILTSGAQIFSGSSFYPGTWGLGLIGPADKDDCQDLIDTIHSVGCGMTDPTMVKTFVEGIHPAIERVRQMGVRLRRADLDTQKEYIPCFDHKHRDWNGIEFDSVRHVFPKKMDALGIRAIPHCELVEILVSGDRVVGAVAVENGAVILIVCGAMVLATGGYGGIFQYHLCTEDVTGAGQALALKAGCRLVNMEFMQMMPGYLSPAFKTIYNERTFRFTRFHTSGGESLFPDTPEWRELLELRSTHGPFTSRLPSKKVDLALFSAFMQDERGVIASYSEEMQRNPPEFVQTYFDWLAGAKGLSMKDPIQLGVFAHAANGGIRIDQDGYTGVPGLFACGEATGGMHGADRIGGLSTANGLVFGGIAGRSAAIAAASGVEAKEWAFDGRAIPNAQGVLKRLRKLMFRNAMVIRNEDGISSALNELEKIKSELSPEPTEDGRQIAACARLESQLMTSECVLRAALARRESRGSHYRSDYPDTDSAQTRMREIWLEGNRIVLH